MRMKLFVLGAVAATVAAFTVLIGGPATASTAATTSTNDAHVTVVHGIPGVPVDVYVNGSDVLPNFQFGTVSPTLSLAPGTYSVVLTAHGSTTPLPGLSAITTLTANENATIVANETATNPSTDTLTVFANPTTPAPAGDAWVLVRHTADAPAVDVYAGTTKVISDLTNPNSAGPLAVPAATVPVSVVASPSTSPTPALIGPVSLKLAPGRVYIAYAIGSAATAPSTLTAVVQNYVVGQAKTGTGYRIVSASGKVSSFGSEKSLGDPSSEHLNAPIVGIASTPDGAGYWLAAADGGVFSYGDATFFGSLGSLRLNAPIVGITPTADDGGYWMVASDGGVFSFGDASFYGSLGSVRLNKPIVGIASTPDGAGYWLVASDGGVFSFGDATFYGSLGGVRLNKPIVGIASTPDGHGYWLVASDGGVFSFGDALFHGSLGGISLVAPVVGITTSAGGAGYWLGAADGGVFSLKATFFGSGAGLYTTSKVVGISS